MNLIYANSFDRVADTQMKLNIYHMQCFLSLFDPQKGEISDSPWKINMEQKNHPIEKANHLPNLHDCVPC